MLLSSWLPLSPEKTSLPVPSESETTMLEGVMSRWEYPLSSMSLHRT